MRISFAMMRAGALAAVLPLFLAGCVGEGGTTPVTTPVTLQSAIQQVQAQWPGAKLKIDAVVEAFVLAKKITPATQASVTALEAKITADVNQLSAVQNPSNLAAIAADWHLLNGLLEQALPGDAGWIALADDIELILMPPLPASPVPAS